MKLKMKHLIITADDFGLSPEINTAVLQAHTRGILTSASLMVSAPAAAEAVAMAKEAPTLKVGLHLTLVEGTSVLSSEAIPGLVDADRRFSDRIVWSGIRYFFSRRLQREIAKECEAQICKFLETGLPIDHLNSHNHLHIHPAVAPVVIALAKKYSIPAVRVPHGIFPFAPLLRRRLEKAGIACNDAIFGLSETGAMVEGAWEKIIPRIGEGITEVYTHPATATTGILKKTTPGYRHQEELEALLNPAIRGRLEKAGIVLGSFSGLR